MAVYKSAYTGQQVDEAVRKVLTGQVDGQPGPVGPQGPTGPRGPAGPEGPQGEPGTSLTVNGRFDTLEALRAAHPMGSRGEAYAIGTVEENNVYVWNLDLADWDNVGPLRGPEGPDGPTGQEGPEGPQGPQGETGPQGEVGPQGVPGTRGIQGERGPQGVQGIQGDTGPQGVQGPPGAPIYASLVRIPFTGWRDNAQTVSAPGVIEDEAAQFIIPIPTRDSREAYYSFGVQCVDQGNGTLLFTAVNTPDTDLSVYVIMQGVSV